MKSTSAREICNGRIALTRLLLVIGLFVATAVPSLIAATMLHADQKQMSQREDMLRLMLAQKIASDIERSANELGGVAVALALSPQAREVFTSTSSQAQSIAMPISGIFGGWGIKTVRLVDASGHVVLDATPGSDRTRKVDQNIDAQALTSSGDEARLVLHIPVKGDVGQLLGQIVIPISISQLVDLSTVAAPILGRISVNALDGRVLIDAEGPRERIAIDVSLDDATSRPQRESGTSATPGGGDLTFANVPTLPLMVAITKSDTAQAMSMKTLLVADMVVLGLGTLGILLMLQRSKKERRCVSP